MTDLRSIPPLQLIRSAQAAPQIFEALRGLIVSVTLEPGAVLSRAELAEHFGVSQTPIRDALLRLDEEGLVDVFAQHATVVSRIDLSAVTQAHFLRRSIELELVGLLADAPASRRMPLVQSLKLQIDNQERFLVAGEHRDFAEADRAFHRELYLAAGMSSLWDLVRQRSGHIDRLRCLHLPTKGKTQGIVRGHRAIVSALQRGGAEEAREAVRGHLSGTLSYVDEIRQRFPAFVRG